MAAIATTKAEYFPALEYFFAIEPHVKGETPVRRIPIPMLVGSDSRKSNH
ncbi:hypothetical protein [Actinacidiphila bryophytorum]|nr:hypothetical protein [Actinacidiphila bryophytorum]UWE10318.1 hypothetical protein NYE86_17405 [Actinacidiphila bryophytorum]